jgi:hypothetical protein
MFAFGEQVEVFLHRTPVDFRKQIDSLAVLVQTGCQTTSGTDPLTTRKTDPLSSLNGTSLRDAYDARYTTL